MKRFLPLLAVLLFPACTSHIQRKETFLTQAGFQSVRATTPSQVAKVNSLKPCKITQISYKGHTLFVYSDPRKKLLLVGGDPQFQRYQHLLYTKVVVPDQAAEQEEKLFDQDYGGWGGMFDPFFGPMWY